MKRILLVEPNPVLASIYTKCFTEAGYEVSHAVSAQGGIDAADAARPDVVVLELQLPKHSGVEFLQEFRSYPEWARIPVVIHSLVNPNRLTDLQQALKRDFGVAAILYKPKTTLDALQLALRTQLAAA